MRGTTTAFFSKLIVIMWDAQTTFWTSYQERRTETPSTIDQDDAKLTEIKAEVTYLYSLRTQVKPAHQSTYFPGNLNTFLKHSTHAQLKAYTQSYGQAIKASIKHHKEQAAANTRNIFTYPGFQRQTATPAATPTMGIPIDQENIPIQNDEEDIPAEPPPIPPPPNIQHQGDPNDTPHIANDEQTANPPRIPPLPSQSRTRIQQSLLATFQRRRNNREIITPALQATRQATPICIPQTDEARHQTVGDYINQMVLQPPASQVSTSDTEETNTPPVIATRASSHYKHLKWRPAAHVREKFSQFFRKR